LTRRPSGVDRFPSPKRSVPVILEAVVLSERQSVFQRRDLGASLYGPVVRFFSTANFKRFIGHSAAAISAESPTVK
jgi:hypothetical protein